MNAHRLREMTSPEFEEASGRGKGVVIPFGSMEAHGRHLPLGTDTIQAEAVCERLAREVDLILAPAIPYGVCLSTRDHPGTVTLTTATLKGILRDLMRSFRRQGVRTFIIVSGHAGRTHLFALKDAAEKMLVEDPSLKIAFVSEYELTLEAAGDELVTPDDRHAGELETSRLMFLEPGLVKGTAPEEYPAGSPYILTAGKRGAWPGSVWGNPAAADPEKGRRLLERSVARLVEIVRRLIES